MSLSNNNVKLKIIELIGKGYNKQTVANILGLPRQTVSDFMCRNTWVEWWDEYGEDEEVVYSQGGDGLSSQFFEKLEIEEVPDKNKKIYKIETELSKPDGCKHFFIPDTQCKPGIDMSYLDWIGKYIVNRKPDVIVHIGDHADMPSLSSYDKGKKSAEGRRVKEDIEAAVEGMNRLLKPLYDLQQEEKKKYGKVLYKPRMIITIGNHEQRIMRHVDANPELYGFLSYDDLRYKEMGWEQYDFLEPVVVNGVTYCHFMANPMTGKPYGGTAMNILKNVGESFTMGHKQCLDVTTRFLPASGKQQWGIVCGAAYPHDEDYKGYQGNKHYRGVIVKHGVTDGSYNPMFVELSYLEKKYD